MFIIGSIFIILISLILKSYLGMTLTIVIASSLYIFLFKYERKIKDIANAKIVVLIISIIGYVTYLGTVRGSEILLVVVCMSFISSVLVKKINE